MKFSIITVCLNPGDKLKMTLESVLQQSCTDWEVVLKDGGSKDGSIEQWQQESAGIPGAERIKVFTERDKGIYDAMNQAVAHATGEFILFLNCGDVFPDKEVLEKTLKVLDAQVQAGTDMEKLVVYGNTYSEKNGVVIASSPEITGFTCYRNIPCHQSCFYSTALCKGKPYNLQYKIRADYDHFLWCFYEAKAKFVHMELPVASYEGGGFSESKANRQRDKQEHKLITSNYMKKSELFKYRAIMTLTLAPVRSAMAESRIFSGMYHWVKEKVYR